MRRKHTFASIDAKRKRYDSAKAYGNPRQWREEFGGCMGFDEAVTVVGHRTPWEILGVSAGARWKSVVSRYSILALATHPDRMLATGPTKEHAERNFKELGAAMVITARAYGEDKPYNY